MIAVAVVAAAVVAVVVVVVVVAVAVVVGGRRGRPCPGRGRRPSRGPVAATSCAASPVPPPATVWPWRAGSGTRS